LVDEFQVGLAGDQRKSGKRGSSSSKVQTRSGLLSPFAAAAAVAAAVLRIYS